MDTGMVTPIIEFREASVGNVEAIHIASDQSAGMQRLDSVEAIEAQGLTGDRYLKGIGFYSARPMEDGGRQVTLIEAEVLEAIKAETGIELTVDEHRRNLTVRGVSLDSLMGKQFQIGDVVLRGVRPCPPCVHLEELTGKQVMAPLVDRGGLRARVERGGTIRVGDAITEL